MFVEDPAIVLDELAVILPLGTESRRPEAASLAQALAKFRKIEYVKPPGTLEGGDVLRVGRKLFVGLSTAPMPKAFANSPRSSRSHGYEVIPVPVTGCLHLKSAVTYLGQNTLLANRAWFDGKPFAGYRLDRRRPGRAARRQRPGPGRNGHLSSFFPPHPRPSRSPRLPRLPRWTSPNSKKPNPA